jgi:hypothetical protein
MRTRILLVAAAILTLVTTLGTASAASASAAPDSRPLAAAAGVGAVKPMALTFSDGCLTTVRPIDCTITEPIVNQSQATYFLTFRPGDHVFVAAGGCVQTGGHGKTWKRYVDPASDNDLYHGLITIPGATGSLDRLVNVVGRSYVVASGGGGNLILGYQDDGYSDNGYYARNDDNGTGNQCLGLGNAFVRIFIS